MGTMPNQAEMSAEPIYIKDFEIPIRNINPLDVVKAIGRVINTSNVEGAQKMGNIWRVYIKSIAKRAEVMVKRKVLIGAVHVPLYDQDPSNKQHSIHAKDKLTIKGLPLPVRNEEIVNVLVENNIQIASTIKYGLMREDDGTLTSFKNGDRFVYVQPFDPPISRNQTIAGYNCIVIHHGKDQRHCKSCNQSGHTVGDKNCPALADISSILAFSGYQHPLSNHYLTPLKAFEEVSDFKSVEHAFFWKMSIDLGYKELASAIRGAEHAGIVKRLSKHIPEDERVAWEEENTDVMRDLLESKAKTCKEFRNCLIENKTRIIAESTPNSKWGTGLSRYVTERTKPEFWPGQNILGMMMMDITEAELMSFASNEEVEEDKEQEEEIEEDKEQEEEKEEDKEQEEEIEEDKEQEDETEEDNEREDEHLNGNQMDADNDGSTTTSNVCTKIMETTTPTSPAGSDKDLSNHTQYCKEKQPRENSDTVNTQKMPKDSDKSFDSKPEEKSRSRPQGRRVVHHTTSKKDIREYFDATTGKRKKPESTPEKKENSKKQVTRTPVKE